MAEERTISRLNGRRGVALLVRRQSGENTVAVADGGEGASSSELRAALPPGYEMIEAMDSSRFIRSAVRDVAVDLAWGAVLASLVVLLFLRNVRSTMITAITIPCLSGRHLRVLLLLRFHAQHHDADGAVAVDRPAHRRRDRRAGERLPAHGSTARQRAAAASSGTDEIGLAVVATTLAICAVFVPIAFMGGVVGRFFREFGLVASCAVSHLDAGRADTDADAVLALPATADATWARLPRSRVGLPVARRTLSACPRLGPASPFGGHRTGRCSGARRGDDRPDHCGRFHDRRGPQRVQRMDQAAARQHRRADAGSRSRRWSASCGGFRPCRRVFATIGGGVQKRVNEARIYVQLATQDASERSGRSR